MNEITEVAQRIRFPELRRSFAKIALSLLVDRDNASGIQQLEDRLICHAIMLSTLDWIASTPNKVALVTGLNRTTVRRRVEKLKNRGILLKYQDNSYIIEPEYANNESNVERLLTLMRTVR